MATKNNEEKQAFTHYQLSTVVVNALGPEAGCVHAVIKNSSKNGYVCQLSIETIGNLLHMSYNRVKRAIEDLLKDGYIEPVSGVNKYNTDAYRYVPEKCEYELTEENMITLHSNDARIKTHKVNRENYKKSLDTEHIKNDTDCIELDTNCIKLDTDCIKPDTNCIPINNSNNYLELKEQKTEKTFSFCDEKHNPTDKQKTEDIKTVIESRTGKTVKAGSNWFKFIEFAIERQKNNPKETIEAFFDYLDSTKYDYDTYSGYNRFMELWPSAFPKEKDFYAGCTHTEKAEVKTYVNFGRYTPTGANQ